MIERSSIKIHTFYRFQADFCLEQVAYDLSNAILSSLSW